MGIETRLEEFSSKINAKLCKSFYFPLGLIGLTSAASAERKLVNITQCLSCFLASIYNLAPPCFYIQANAFERGALFLSRLPKIVTPKERVGVGVGRLGWPQNPGSVT